MLKTLSLTGNPCLPKGMFNKDILFNIFSNLSFADAKVAALTCKDWKAVYDNHPKFIKLKKLYLCNEIADWERAIIEGAKKENYLNENKWLSVPASMKPYYASQRQFLIEKGIRKIREYLDPIIDEKVKTKTILMLLDYLRNLENSHEYAPQAELFSFFNKINSSDCAKELKLEVWHELVKFLDLQYIHNAVKSSKGEEIPLLINNYEAVTESSERFTHKMRFFGAMQYYACPILSVSLAVFVVASALFATSIIQYKKVNQFGAACGGIMGISLMFLIFSIGSKLCSKLPELATLPKPVKPVKPIISYYQADDLENNINNEDETTPCINQVRPANHSPG